jgi:hypothetical protein
MILIMILRDVPLSPKYGFMLIGKSEQCKSKGQDVYCRCARQFQYRVKSKSNHPDLWTEIGKGGWWEEKTSRSGEAAGVYKSRQNILGSTYLRA